MIEEIEYSSLEGLSLRIGIKTLSTTEKVFVNAIATRKVTVMPTWFGGREKMRRISKTVSSPVNSSPLP